MTGHAASLLTVFGATGDLAQRMLLPSLYGLQGDGLLPRELRILGTARSDLNRDAFRQLVARSIEQRVPAAERNEATLRALLERMDYCAASVEGAASMQPLTEAIRAARGTGDAVYHLSTAPRHYAPLCSALGEAGLTDAGTRVLLEKPIGHDLATSIAINDGVAAVFDEDRVFRVDHYLGKEGVQNLLALRFGNALFEPLWNARHVEQVQITVAESVGSKAAATTTTTPARCATCCRTTCCSCCA
jgi:glucose-6-phosphate 1-dehydrogenase